MVDCGYCFNGFALRVSIFWFGTVKPVSNALTWLGPVLRRFTPRHMIS
jgi:hypothetical protein